VGSNPTPSATISQQKPGCIPGFFFAISHTVVSSFPSFLASNRAAFWV
jgi:hypothetical protein